MSARRAREIRVPPLTHTKRLEFCLAWLGCNLLKSTPPPSTELPASPRPPPLRGGAWTGTSSKRPHKRESTGTSEAPQKPPLDITVHCPFSFAVPPHVILDLRTWSLDLSALAHHRRRLPTFPPLAPRHLPGPSLLLETRVPSAAWCERAEVHGGEVQGERAENMNMGFCSYPLSD